MTTTEPDRQTATVPALFTRGLGFGLQRPCLNFEGRSTTYGQLAAQIDAASAGLARLNIGPGSRVALLLPNSPGFIVMLLAILRRGATAVPLNPAAPVERLEAQIRSAGARLLVSYDLAPTFAATEHLIAALALERAIVLPFLGALPTAKTVLYRLTQGTTLAAPERSPHAGRLVTEARLIDGASAVPDVAIDPHRELAVLMPTAGSSGPSKLVGLTHAALVANVDQLLTWSAGAVRPGLERLLAVMPFFHSFGLTGVALFGLAGGHELILMPKFDLESTHRVIAAAQPTLLAGVPSLFQALARPRRQGTADLRCVRLAVSAGAPLAPTTRSAFAAVCPAPLCEAYGLTEAAPAVTIQPWQHWNKPASTGLPLADTTVTIRDPDRPDRLLPAGQTGEIVISGPQVTGPPGHLLQTGDLGYLDRDGALYVLDRREDVILVAGFRVFARRIEERLLEHPAVDAVAVVGMSNGAAGQLPVAHVVLREGMAADSEDLVAFAAAGLTRLEVPARIVVCEDLPRTVIGKPDKLALRAG